MKIILLIKKNSFVGPRLEGWFTWVTTVNYFAWMIVSIFFSVWVFIELIGTIGWQTWEALLAAFGTFLVIMFLLKKFIAKMVPNIKYIDENSSQGTQQQGQKR